MASGFCAPPAHAPIPGSQQHPKRTRRPPPPCCSARPFCATPLESILRDAVAKVAAPNRDIDPASISVIDATVGPGQLNEHYRVTVADSASFLCKVSRRGGEEAFLGEALSLKLLAEACDDNDDLSVTVPLASGSIDSGLRAYSVFPWVDFAPFGSAIPSVQKALGAGLARIHMRSADVLYDVHQGRFGFPVATWLGGAPQANDWSAPGDWLGFFVSQRLEPRLQEALNGFGEQWGTSNESVLALNKLGSRVCSVRSLRVLFEGVDVSPSLLHGDMFMGNAGSYGRGRVACLYDAAYALIRLR
jgi:fructosamine-3-kinase